MGHYLSDEEICLLADGLISDWEIKDLADAKWYTEEMDCDEETQSRVYIEVVWLLGLGEKK
jgi:hypothetical protein